MFALTGKLFDWSIKEYNSKKIVNLILFKKKQDKEYKYCFSTFSQRIIELLEQRTIASGDTVEIKFYIKCREYNGKWYTDLYADEMLVIKKGKASSMNVFEGMSFKKSFEEK